MKNQLVILKRHFAGILFPSVSAVFVLLFLISSYNNEKKPEDTKEVAEEHNDAKFDNSKEKDAQFLVTAAEINLEEVNLGQLAQNKGTMADVKALGKMMETEHSAAQKDLQALAAKKQITLPHAWTVFPCLINMLVVKAQVYILKIYY